MGYETQNSLNNFPQAEPFQDELSSINLLDIVESIDIGLAVFDEELNLKVINDRYRELCDYSPEEVEIGTPLKNLIYISLARRGLQTEEIENAISITFQRLRGSEHQQFRFEPQMEDIYLYRVDEAQTVC